MPAWGRDMRWRVRTFRVPMFVIAAALLGLVLVLAILQYRWLGRISDAERDRMTANLGAHAAGLAQEFDHELTRAYATFQMEPAAGGENLAAKMALRYERWMATSRYPRLVRDIFIARPQNGVATLQRYSPTSRFIEPAEWPSSMLPVRDAIARPVPRETQGSKERPGTVLITTVPPAIWEQVPALVVPMPMIFFNPERRDQETAARPRLDLNGMNSFVIVHLAADYIAKEMLPAMVEQRFRSAGTAYQVAVVNATGGDVIYRSDAAFSPAPNVKPDASAAFFQVRLQEFGAIVSEIRRVTSATGGARESFEVHRLDPQRPGAAANPSLSIRLQHSLDVREPAVVSGDGAAISRPPLNTPRWRLVVKHPSGSLEAAVNSARRRNIFISTSVMALLGISVGFLIVTTRRSQELARQQMEFVAAVSHELRTPLAVIRSAADNLAEGVVHDHPQVRKYGDLVRVEGRRLSEMVEQILELAGIQSGQRSFALRPVAVLPLLHDVMRASSTLIADARIDTELEIPESLPPVLGDEAALRRVFQNLVGNAIKYGASGGWIGVTARPAGREVVVTVADRGIGIPASEHARIFEPFYRAPNVVDAQQIQGAGLGLSLVWRIVEAHGGRIQVRSTEGHGSEFSVHLPSAAEEPVTRMSVAHDAAHRLP